MDARLAERLAWELMCEHGLHDWQFSFDRARRRFGACHYDAKKITLSRALTELNDEAHVRDTILHEIAHALVPKKHGHDAIWRAKAREIGCNPKRCYTDAVVTPPGKYTVTCAHCERAFQAQRRRLRAACGECCRQFNQGKYDPKFRLIYRLNDSRL